MRRILHILPHRGGGAETFIDAMEGLEGYEHERVALSESRSALGAALSIPPGWTRAARAARRFDLVHAHGDTAAMLSLPILARHPSVWSGHGLHLLRRVTGARRAVAKRWLRRVIGSATVTLCSSQAEVGELGAIADGAGRDRIRSAHNGIPTPRLATDEQRTRIRRTLGLEPDDVAFLYAGQLEPRKDPLTAVSAAIEARYRGANVVLLVAGAGPLEDDVAAAASPAIRRLGFRDDVSTLLDAADVFVMPSEREGQSLAVLEALGHGRATVVSDGIGNPETVGDAGIVFPFGDPDALADVFIRLAADPAERERLQRAARVRFESEFTAEHFHERMRAVYEEACPR